MYRPDEPRPADPRIREWAHANGYEISNRGRIPAEVEQAYREAN